MDAVEDAAAATDLHVNSCDTCVSHERNALTYRHTSSLLEFLQLFLPQTHLLGGGENPRLRTGHCLDGRVSIRPSASQIVPMVVG
jgi:hypothetical protein